MCRSLVKHVDRRPEHCVRFNRKVLFNRLQRLTAGFIHEVDDKAFGVAGHDIDRHILDHLHEPLCLVLFVHLRRHDVPAQDRIPLAACAIPWGYLQMQVLASQTNPRGVRQVCRVGKKAALMGRVLVEYVDTGPDNVLRVDAELMPELAQQGDRCRVGISDHESVEITDHDSLRQGIQHTVVVRFGSPGDIQLSDTEC